MHQKNINEFAESLINFVRDISIKECDRQLSNGLQTPVAERWRKNENIQSVIIPDCVDEVLFNLLDAIDNGNIRLSFLTKSGEIVDLSQEGAGELAGLYMCSGGWRSKYSDERFNDDFSDLSS